MRLLQVVTHTTNSHTQLLAVIQKVTSGNRNLPFSPRTGTCNQNKQYCFILDNQKENIQYCATRRNNYKVQYHQKLKLSL